MAQSPAAADEEGRGKHLFAEVWRFALQKRTEKGKNLFEACFGGQKEFHWYPLSNALHTENGRHPDADYILDESRSFHCRGGRWTEERYEELYFDRKRLEELLHEADRAIRRYLKTGRNLQEKPTEAWARPYAEAILEADRKAALEALKPKITIDLSGLEQIRRAASITRDSLLKKKKKNEARDGGEPVLPTDNTSIRLSSETAVTKPAPAEAEEEGQMTFDGLDEAHFTILQTLLRGETAEEQIRSAHLMPALVVDTINEAFYDEIGDNILEYDGNEISLIEDYREDIAAILGGCAR